MNGIQAEYEEIKSSTELLELPSFLVPGSKGYRILERTNYTVRLVDIWDWWRAINEGYFDGVSASERHEWIGEALYYLHRSIDICANEHQRRGWRDVQREENL